MKAVMMILMALTVQKAFADTTTTTMISADQFKNEAKDFLENSIQNGELEGIGDECSMNVKNEDGRTYIILTTATGMKYRSVVDGKKPVKLTATLSEDGSFQKRYKFGSHKELHMTHMDDAYAHATLIDGVTSLNCGVYY